MKLLTKARFFGAAAIMAASATTLAQNNTDERLIDETYEYLHALEQQGMACSFVLWKNGEYLIANGFGLADRESGLSWSPDVVSTIGSLTKQFTGAAILKLQEQGKLSVSDPITKYFDDVPADKEGITLHHLLAHSSGIHDLQNVGDFTPINRDELVRRVMNNSLIFEPGSAYRYSNAGYSMLGAILELVTGEDYEQWIRRELFLPNDMKDTGYIIPEFDPSITAKGYRDGESYGTVVERIEKDGPSWVLRANGGIHTTARDMIRWGEALLKGAVLSEHSMDLYWGTHTDESNSGKGESYYGYGWVVIPTPDGHRIITHNGSNRILGAEMAILPESQTIIFVQTNVMAENDAAMRVTQNILNRLLNNTPYPTITQP